MYKTLLILFLLLSSNVYSFDEFPFYYRKGNIRIVYISQSTGYYCSKVDEIKNPKHKKIVKDMCENGN